MPWSRRCVTRTARNRLSGIDLTDRDLALILAGLFELRITHLEHADLAPPSTPSPRGSVVTPRRCSSGCRTPTRGGEARGSGGVR